MRQFLLCIAAVILLMTLTLGPTLASASVAEGYSETLIADTRELIAGLGRDEVTTPGHQVALMNFYRQALEAIDAGDLATAIRKLEDARDRSDGCIRNDSPDTGGPSRDWITNCEVQIEVVHSSDLATVLLTSVGLGYSEGSLSDSLNAGQRDFPNPIGGGAFVFDFQPDNTGRVIFVQGESPITWSINAAGEIEVSLIDPPEIVNFPNCDVPSSPAGQCRAITSVQSLRILRISDSPTFDQILVLPTTVTTYPDDPLPDEIDEALPDLANVFVAFSDEDQLPFDTDALARTPLALTYGHRENAAAGFIGDLGADLLTFNADGSGFTQRRGFTFTWQQDGNGGLDLEFESGDLNRFIRYTGAEISQAITVSRTMSGDFQARAFHSVEYDGVSAFTEDQLANRRYSSVATILNPTTFLIDFGFLPDGSGCRIFGGGNTVPFLWESSAEEYMDYIRYLSSDFITPLERRAWQAVRVEPGIIGPRYWVIETLEFSGFDPAYVFAEPELTPGRINAYEFIDDLSDDVDPCGFGD